MSLINVTIIDREGIEHKIEAPTDINMNVMELCKANDLPVEGTCGGMAMCASCHCYIESGHEIFNRSDAEEDMLDQAFFVEQNSRLGCQIKLADDLEGLILRLAPESN
jgi:ferredoxin